ncbi:baseplate J/gp47 family protein [Shewanella surugensis]|uniref:Baseplate J/gp47 family protein n=1 Tax=Shewanella surugensis TaxID=212020 RepID=A0ABT0L773_9GAMM|nr:baseplate J/gp47 family protein [Shewanella surugensis]MCL1123521.1 baseplate J/gp47 family protein [Shewanella surugensis]
MSRPKVNFDKVLAEKGVPLTSAEVTTLLLKDMDSANSTISNDSRMSPFWKLILKAVITPVLWLINVLLVQHVLPAMFTATATKLFLDLKAWEVGLSRKEAVNTQGYITFTKQDVNSDIAVPKGSVIKTDSRLGGIYSVSVMDDSFIPSGIASLAVECIADEAGASHNIGAGYFYVMDEMPSGIASVSNVGDWITQTGADDEEDDALALRIRDQFLSVGQYHIDAVYRGAIASFAGVRSDFLFFEHNAPRGPGTANCHVMMDVGEPPQSLINSINQHVRDEGHHGHGDDMLVMPIGYTEYDLTFDIWHGAFLNDVEQQTLLSELESRIRAAFRESDNFDTITRVLPQKTFSFSLLSSQLHNELGNLASIKYSHADINSGLSLPRIKTLTLNNVGAAT